MRMLFKAAMLFVAIFIAIAPASAGAYSYGDANTEDVAETFKIVVSALGKSPADWKTAEAAHKERRDEFASHFGEEVAATLDANMKSQNAEVTIANYKAMLVMNLDRRFDNAIQSVNDYTQAKLLLAKARATYETLAPYAESKLSKEDLDGLSADFDAALEAIGNPGLFGVGKKEADEKALKAAVNQIYGALKPLFPYTPEASAGNAGNANTGTGDSKNPDAAVQEAEPDTIDGTKQHAAMAHETKTNPAITVGVIAGVIVIGGGAVYWARRKGLL
ncbi:hypothetical protein GZH47_18175 [Paenibacillus rhizovicinus]|uniref:LPXTG cell wall anchor domain-containing protein n=1 Tax=Paenibacillus rhizovicinus TaxID=2704463 RepID=A0A6C0P231_9BACL|nr:hypothetical protein [Paenibacillus rhizovicinus]QHW32548.1 hypothetical protein GZH47_18175 [Paenibacillus rhizovicinus]